MADSNVYTVSEICVYLTPSLSWVDFILGGCLPVETKMATGSSMYPFYDLESHAKKALLPNCSSKCCKADSYWSSLVHKSLNESLCL